MHPGARARRVAALGFALLASCHAGSPPRQVVPSASALGLYDPAHALGPLFADVQNARVFPDSKTFVDVRPLMDPARIVREYEAARRAAGFDLRAFVASHFEAPAFAAAPVAAAS